MPNSQYYRWKFFFRWYWDVRKNNVCMDARVSVYHMGFLVWFMVFNATFNNILVISWQSV